MTSRQFPDEVESWDAPRLELYEHIDVTVGPEVVAKDRAEQGQARDTVSSTRRRHRVTDRSRRARHRSFHDYRWRGEWSPARLSPASVQWASGRDEASKRVMSGGGRRTNCWKCAGKRRFRSVRAASFARPQIVGSVPCAATIPFLSLSRPTSRIASRRSPSLTMSWRAPITSLAAAPRWRRGLPRRDDRGVRSSSPGSSQCSRSPALVRPRRDDHRARRSTSSRFAATGGQGRKKQ